jgi:hypothetical protein
MAGCQAPRLDPGRVVSAGVGAHAGWVRRANGTDEPTPMIRIKLFGFDCPGEGETL